MSDNFSIRFSYKFVSFTLQPFLQFQIIFNNPVVHHHNLPAAIPVGVRIFFRRTAMRSPPRVSDAIGAFNRRFGDHFFQITKFPCGAPNFQFALGRDHRDARRVISPVFEFPQAFDDDRNYFFRADVADNAAHEKALLTLLFKVNMRENCAGKIAVQCRETGYGWMGSSGAGAKS